MSINTDNNTHAPLHKVLGEIAAFWVLANVGYYVILPMLGYQLSYNSAPIVIAAYFLLWALISTAYFWELFKNHFTAKYKIWTYSILSLGSAALIWGLLYLFSSLPIPHGPNLAPYTDILFATPWYFLPKSTEILVQQILISVLLLEFSLRFNSLKETIIGYAICFGGAHVLLFYIGNAPIPYAIIMIAGSLLSALIFPYLILRVRGGFVYSYMIHLIFYILLAILLHTWPLHGYVL
jgi:hypothetical protein